MTTRTTRTSTKQMLVIEDASGRLELGVGHELASFIQEVMEMTGYNLVDMSGWGMFYPSQVDLTVSIKEA